MAGATRPGWQRLEHLQNFGLCIIQDAGTSIQRLRKTPGAGLIGSVKIDVSLVGKARDRAGETSVDRDRVYQLEPLLELVLGGIILTQMAWPSRASEPYVVILAADGPLPVQLAVHDMVAQSA